MELVLTRNWKKQDYTIGRLYVNGVFECNTLEPPVRPTKAHPKGAIPQGRYEVTLNVISPKYSKKKAYDWCEGRLPRYLGVRGFDGILMHAGNTVQDTVGCTLVGRNTAKGMLTDSQKCLKQVWQQMEQARLRREKVWITIQDEV